MGYRPYHDGAPALTASQLNSNYFEGWITVNSQAELTALLSSSVISGQTFPAVPIGTFALRTDNDTLYVVNSSNAWETFCDFSALRTSGRPYYSIYSTTGTYLGRVSMTVAGDTATFLVENSAGTDMFQVAYDSTATGVKTSIQATDASGLRLSSANTSYNLTLTDTETLLQSVTGLRLKAASLLLEDTAGTAGPVLSIGGSSAGADRMLATSATGALTALAIPTGYPSFMPTTIGTEGQGLLVSGGAVVFGTVATSGGGVELTDVLAQTTYTAATAGSANLSATQALPSGFQDDNEFVYVQAGLDQSYVEATMVACSYLAGLTGTGWLNVEGIVAGNIQYQPSTRSLRIARTGRNPRLMYVGLIASGTGTGGGATSLLGLTDTPATYGTAGQTLVMNAAGTATEWATAGTGTIADDTITPPMLAADSQAQKQAFLNRLNIPIHETLSTQDFQVFSGFLSSAGLVGFASTQLGTINGSTSGATFRANNVLYTITQIAQVTTTGSTLNNIIVRIGPDPGDDLTEWQFQIGTSVLLDFSSATKATVPGNRVTYTWTGNTRLFIGGQNTACSIRIPLVEQFVVAPINFSQIQGNIDPTQFRDSSIAYTRAIAGTPAEQAGWRTKSGFAAFTNAGNRVLKYINNQVQQASLDIYDLDNVVPTANLVAPTNNQIAIWTVNGLDSVATLSLHHLPPGNATGQVPEWDGTRWTLISTPSGGTGSAASWSTLGRMPSTYANMPAVSATDNGKFLGVASGAWSLFQPALSSFTGNLPANRIDNRLTLTQLPSSLPFTILDLSDATKQSAARTALGITTGSQTIGNSSVSARMLDLYTGTASNSPVSPAKQRTFRHALGVDEDRGYVRYLATLAAGLTGGGDAGFSASSPMVGSITAKTGFTGRTFTVAGTDYSIEEILYDEGATPDANELRMNISRPVPAGDEIFIKIGNLSFSTSEASTSASSDDYTTGGWLFQWAGVPNDLLVSGSSYDIEIGGALEQEIQEEFGELEPLRTLPTTSDYKFAVANNTGTRWGTLTLDGADEASFLFTVTAVNKPNQDTTVVALSGSGNSNFFTRSGNYLTARKAGWAHVAITARPGAANTGQVKVHARVSNRDVLRSDRTIEHYRDVISWVFPYNFSVGDTLSFWYEARDVPASANAASVPATPSLTITEDDANREDRIQITSPSTGLFNAIQISKRVHGAGTTQWTEWETLEARVNDFRVSRLYGLETDYRVRLTNAAGAGRYRQWLAGGGTTFTQESTSAYGQTVNFNGDIHISRQSTAVS